MIFDWELIIAKRGFAWLACWLAFLVGSMARILTCYKAIYLSQIFYFFLYIPSVRICGDIPPTLVVGSPFATAFHCIKAMFLTTDIFFIHGTSNFNLSAWIRTQYFDSRFVYNWKVDHNQKSKLPVAITNHYIFGRSGTGEQRFPGLGSVTFYSSCFLLFCSPFLIVKLHSYTVMYMFLNFSTQWNSIRRGNRRWKAALEPGTWISLHFILLFFRTKQGAWHERIKGWWRIWFSFHKN